MRHGEDLTLDLTYIYYLEPVEMLVISLLAWLFFGVGLCLAELNPKFVGNTDYHYALGFW
jgi:hypothetical protein